MNLQLVNVVSNMTFVIGLGNIGSQTRHELDVIDISFLPFELEVTVDSNVEDI